MSDDQAVSDEQQRPAQTVASILGEIAWLMCNTRSHRYFFLGDLEWLVMPVIMKQQFRIYRDENSRPVGLVLWAKLNEESEKSVADGNARLRPQDWDSGDRHWIIDLIDLSGQRSQAIIDDMKQNVFGETPFKYHKVEADGSRSVISSTDA